MMNSTPTTQKKPDEAQGQLVAALEAAQQCIVDFLDVYKRGCSMVVLDLAVKDLQGDALPKINAALKTVAGDSK